MLHFTIESCDTLKSFSFVSVTRQTLKTKNQPSWFTFSGQRRIWSLHVVVLQRTAKKCTKIYSARAKPLPCSLKISSSDVPVAVAVAVVVFLNSLMNTIASVSLEQVVQIFVLGQTCKHLSLDKHANICPWTIPEM